MYATEKYVRMEVKDVHSQIQELANDLGGDIRFLHQEITEQRNLIEQLIQDLEEMRERLNAQL
jgi:predicted RNase H-like nuclease (RuvC/YqgF family)